MASREYHDRRTDYRDPYDRYRGPPRDYRERERDRDRERDRERDRDHDFRRDDGRETGVSRDQHGKSYSDKSTPRSHGQRTSSAPPGSKPASGYEPPVWMELLGEMSTYYGQLSHAKNRFNRIEKELEGSGSRPTEFGSVGELKRRELEKCGEEITRLQQKLDSIYPKLQAEFDSWLRLSANSVTRPGIPAHIRNQPELEPRLMELHKSITKVMETRLQKEVKALQETIDEEKRKNQVLADKFEAGQSKNQSLEERISQLEQMFETIKPAVEVQISAEIATKIKPRMSSLEQNLNKGLANNVETTKQLQSLVDGHTKQLASLTSKFSADPEAKTLASDPEGKQRLQSATEHYSKQLAGLKCDSPVDAKSSTTVAQTEYSNVIAKVTELRNTLEIQGQNTNSLQEKLEQALSKSREFEKAIEQSSGDSRYAKALVERQSSTIDNQGKKQKSLEEDFSALQNAARDQAEKYRTLDSAVTSLCSGQADKQRVIDTTIASLRSKTEGFIEKQNSLAASLASLDSSIKNSMLIQDGQTSVLASLQSSVKQEQKRTKELEQKLVSADQTSELSALQSSIEKQQKRSESLEKAVASLKIENAERSPQDFEKLAEKIQDYPPAADLSRIVADFPSSKDFKMLIADVLKLRDSVSKLKARNTPPPSSPSSSMSKEAIAQTVDARIVQLDIATKKEINGLFESFAKIMDGIEDRTSKSVTTLDERVSKFGQELDENKRQTKMAKEVGESLQKRCSEPSGELKKAVGVLVEEVEKLRGGTKKQFDDVQFRINWLDDWTKNLTTRQWHDSVAQHIANYVPAHFNGQLNSLATRVSNLENRGHDSEGASKRRRVANGSPLVMNGAH